MRFAMRATMATAAVLALTACGGDKGADSNAAATVAPAPATVTDRMGTTGGMPMPMGSTMKHDSTGAMGDTTHKTTPPPNP